MSWWTRSTSARSRVGVGGLRLLGCLCCTAPLERQLGSAPGLPAVPMHLPVTPLAAAGDFLMALLRDLVALRRAAGRPLKVVLMSATLDSSLFADYFAGVAG